MTCYESYRIITDRENSEDDVEESFDGVEEETTEHSYSPSFKDRDEPDAKDSSSIDNTQNVEEQQPDLEPILQNLNDITNLIKEYFEQSRENRKVENKAQKQYLRHQRLLVGIAAVTFLLVVGISAGMTAINALSGDAFTFVLGTLFGAILTFLQNMISDNRNAN